MTLKNKTAFITGTNRGIGKAILKEFAKNGAEIFAHARKETPEFVEMISSISEKNKVKITPIYFDMTDTIQMKEAVKKQIFKTKTKIDVLVNSAGIAHGGFFVMTPMSKIKEVFEVNLFAQMELTQLILKIMTKQQNGSIINFGSVLGLDITKGSCAYGVSKAAVIAWTKTLASEYSKYNIRSNAIAPGLIDTDMSKQMEENAAKIMIEQSAMKRLGKPEEIAKAAMFLASEDASFINGQILRVDGYIG